MKDVLISIRPEWCAKIASGQKTVEVRKTRPKLETPFKVYIYCTKSGRPLVYGDVVKHADVEKFHNVFNGRVIGEFVCDCIFPIEFYASDASFFDTEPSFEIPGTMLTDKEIAEYLGNGKTGYGWYISALQIYDKPLALLVRPPQDWCYVEVG